MNVGSAPVASWTSRISAPVLRVVDERLARGTAGHEELAVVVLDADGCAAFRSGYQHGALAGAQVTAEDRAGGDRAYVERGAVSDRYAFRLPPVRQRDRLGEVGARQDGRCRDCGNRQGGQEKQYHAAHESSFHIAGLARRVAGRGSSLPARRPRLRVAAYCPPTLGDAFHAGRWISSASMPCSPSVRRDGLRPRRLRPRPRPARDHEHGAGEGDQHAGHELRPSAAAPVSTTEKTIAHTA